MNSLWCRRLACREIAGGTPAPQVYNRVRAVGHFARLNLEGAIDRVGVCERLMGEVKNFLRKMVGALGGRAVRKHIDGWLTAYADWRFDRRFGTETKPILELDQLDIDSENRDHGVHYQPTQTRPFNLLMSTLSLGKNATFVDLGSGMGRALMLASEYGFKRVVGVEYAKNLCEIANQNMAIYRRKTGSDAKIALLHLDAAKYAIQDSDTVFYLYNPFHDAVMRQVVENIHQSVLRAPRKVYIIYLNPLCRKVIEGHPGFEMIFEQLYHRSRFVVYSSIYLVRLQAEVDQLGRSRS